MKIADHLSVRQIDVLTRIGDIIIPQNDTLPSFSQTDTIEATVYLIANLPDKDVKQLKMLLTLFSYLPASRVEKLIERGASNPSNPSGFDAKLVEIYGSLQGLLNIAYFAASPKVPEPPQDENASDEPNSLKSNADKSKRIAVIATLDTRGDEVELVREMLAGRGHQAIVIDMGVMGIPEGKAEYTRGQVAEAGGRTIEALIADAKAGAERGKATNVMIGGARKIVFDLLSKGEVDGILGLGGSTAASSAIRVMTGLPVGMPKVLLTSMAKTANIGEEDITVIQSPVDLVGLNNVVHQTLNTAAGAIAGMVEQGVYPHEAKKVVGLTALGVTTPAVMKVLAGLEARGYEGVVFHALTDKFNQMIKDGLIDAVIDMTTFEMTAKVFYSDEQIKGATGVDFVDRTRLKAAETKQIPQLIVPGGIDIHIIPGARSADMLPKELQGRPFAMHGPDIMLVRTGAMENQLVGLSTANRLKRATAPACVLIPQQGFSDASRIGSHMHDANADKAYIDSLQSNADSNADIQILDCAINDDAFAEHVLTSFEALMAKS